jgi:plastocyanin
VPLGCLENHSGELYSDEISVNNGHLKNVLVRITKGLEGKTFGDVPQEPVVLDQKNCMYQPRVIAARVGQKVEIVNSDPVIHNVRAVTSKNNGFNDVMPKQDEKIVKIFDRPEIFLQTKCDIHPWMNAYVAVLDHPFFSVTGDDGEFRIKDLPVGDYTLEAWHEVLGTQTKEISVKENEELNLDFQFKK